VSSIEKTDKGPSAKEQTARAKVVADLLTAQSNHIAALKWAVGVLEGKISLRNSLAEVQAEALRTPFRDVMNSFNQLKAIAEQTSDPEIKRLAREINECSNQIKRAVKSIGDWLSASTDPTILYPREALQKVELKSVVSRAVSEVGTSMDKSRLEIIGVDGLLVTTAPARLAAIITAVLENAFRHGGNGKVELVADINLQQDLKLEIRDNGPGIQNIDPELLFMPKPQVVSENQEWAPLLGLGLFLVRMMAESLGGTVTLANRDKSGAVLTIILPQRRRKDVAQVK
jgi:two-component system sensor histidine kinase KdpD